MATETIDKVQVEVEATAKGTSAVFQQLENQLKTLQKALGAIDTSQLQAVKQATQSMKLDSRGFTKEEREVIRSLDKIKQAFAGMEAYKNAALNGDTSSLTSFNRKAIHLQSDIDKLAERFKQLDDMMKGGNVDSAMFQVYREQLAEMQSDLNSAQGEVEKFNSEASNGPSLDTGETESKLQIIAQGAKQAGRELLQLGGKAIRAALSGLRSALNKVKDGISNVASRTGGLSKLFNSGFMKLLKYGFGIRSLYVGFRRLRKAIVESFGELQKSGAFYETTRANIEALKNSLSLLKFQFGAAFEPIFNAVAPALQTLVNYLLAAMNAFSAFIAKLTGKSTYSKAVAATGKIASNAGSAAGSAKELNKQLQGFDELNNLTSNSGGGGGGGAGGGGDEGALYEEANVESALGDFGKRLAEAIKKGDWKAVGSIISQKLTEVMEGIPWDKIFKKAENFGKNLANFLNGLITPELFSALGKTIGNAIKTKLTFLNSFGETFEWKNFGNSIASGINGFVATNPLKLAAKTINTWSKGILDALITAVDNVSWKTIAKHIADFLADLDFKGVGIRLGKLVNSIANAIYDLVSNKDTWINLGTKIADGINGFVSTTDWGKVAFTLSALVSGLISAVSNLVQKTNWDAVGSAVVEMIAGIDWEKLLGNSVVLLGAIVKGLLSLFLGIGSKLSEKLAKAFESVGEDTLAGFFKGISDNIKTSTKWVKEKFNIFIKAVKDFFGIHSPSTVFAKIGTDCIDGLKKGFTTAISKLKSWIKTNITGKIVGFFSGVKDIVVDVKGKVDSSFEKAKEAWESVKTKTETLWAEAKEKVKGALNTLQSKWNDWKPALKELWTSAKEKAGGLVDTIKDKWEYGWNTVKELFTEAKEKAGSTIDNLKSAWDKWTGKDTQKTLTATATDNGSISNVQTTWKNAKFDAKTLKATATDNKSISNLKKTWTNASFKDKDLKANVDLKAGNWNSFASVGAWAAQWGTSINAYVNLQKGNFSSVQSWLSSVFGSNGATSGGTNTEPFNKHAKGGALYGGMWHDIPQFANGTLDALKHGTIFAAGEAGPEIVGHINGRTEVLNRSQIASTVFQAITNGMKQFKNAQMVQPPQLAYASGSVASYDGISQGNNEAMIAEQNRLLAEQNRLLQIIAQKDVSISSTDVFNATRSEANSFYNRTGNSPFLY